MNRSAQNRHGRLSVALSFPGCHRRGGIERVVVECANFLASRGHDARVFASDWDPAALHPAVAVHPVAARGRFAVPRLLRYARESRRALRGRRPAPDVLATFGAMCPPGGVMWVPSVQKAWLEISRSRRDWRGRLRQRLNPFHPVILAMERFHFTGRNYRRLIALTPQVKRDLVRLYDVPERDVLVLPNGYSAEEFNVSRTASLREEMRSRLGYADGQKVVIFVANELERKGFGPLLRAIASLKDRDVCLLAVGRLDGRAALAEADRLGLAGRVKFAGPSADVATYYAAADLFALPTQYEPWGLVIVEALACGLPVLTSRLAGASGLVREGRNGWLLDDPWDESEIANKLRRLLEGQHDAAAVAGPVAGCTWPSVLAEYERVLAACAGTAPADAPLPEGALTAGVTA